jgi:CheY-like chemotaxis protein
VILIVDDEPGVRDFVRMTLQRAGYETEEAASADEALRKIRKQTPRILLTDIVMPGKNGLWLAAQVHRLAPSLPVLFISGFAEDYEQELSGSVCLRKPFTPAELVAAVNDIMEARRSGGGA